MSRVSQALGQLGNERGRRGEERLLSAVENLAMLGRKGLNLGRAWVTSARLAMREEDARGIDVVVETDIGLLYLQSKSSRAQAKAFRSKRRGSAIEVVLATDNDALLLARARMALGKLRSAVLERRGGR